MVIGCGTDIVETERFKNAVRRWEQSFLERVFTAREIAYAMRRRFYQEHLAARFAAKEAVFKAFGDGFSRINFKDVEIINDENGRPRVLLYGVLEQLRRSRQVSSILISLSHSRAYAQAMALLISDGTHAAKT
ncbi:MAG: holo-ACP synthase [Candidatus Omnitrophica bacterium]|nr:holo-ACP synthase [Candidatus Omnitrophota bacterium]